MRGANQSGPSPWQQGSVPQQQPQAFHSQQQQQQRQYQQPQMMQQQQRPQQQPGNWGGNPAWGNQGGQGKVIKIIYTGILRLCHFFTREYFHRMLY